MGADASEPVIELDDQGVALLQRWARPCTHFGVTWQRDGSIVLHPMSAIEADLWRSGLVGQIIDSFARSERMIRVKPDKL